jgi:hypothetical protein
MPSPASGPSTSATATARLRLTTGEPVRRESSSYNQVATPEPRLATGLEQQQHRHQTVNLRLVGHQFGECPPEPERLGRQVAPATVALVEDQVDHGEHGGEPVGQQVVGRHPKRDPCGLDLALGPHQPLGHRRFGDQECASDLAGCQSPERPKGESDLRVSGECRMTAREDELESLVRKCRRVHRGLRSFGHLEQASLRGQRAISADAVDRSVARRRHQPGARVRGGSVSRPALRGDREGLLRGRPARGSFTAPRSGAPRSRRPDGLPGSVRRARSPHRGRRPRTGGSRRPPP